MTEAERNAYRLRAVQRVRERYDWELVTTQYETLLQTLGQTAPQKRLKESRDFG